MRQALGFELLGKRSLLLNVLTLTRTECHVDISRATRGYRYDFVIVDVDTDTGKVSGLF